MKIGLLACVCALLVLGTLIVPAKAGGSHCDRCRDEAVHAGVVAAAACYQNGGTTVQCDAAYAAARNNYATIFCNYGMGCEIPMIE